MKCATRNILLQPQLPCCWGTVLIPRLLMPYDESAGVRKGEKWFRREDRRIPPNILQLYKYSTDLYRKGLHFNYSLKFESQIHCHISSIQHDHTPSNPRTSLVWKEAASVDRLAPTWRTPARLGSSRVAWRSFLEKSASIWQRKT